MEEMHFKLGELPLHILEHVLHFLPGNNLASLSSTNKTFFNLINKILRQKFFVLVRSIFISLQQLGQEISQLPEETDLLLRAKWLRSYFMLELLHNEISMIKPLCRDTLYGSQQHQMYTIGPLLNEMEILLNEARERNLPPWNISDERTVKILRFTKSFIDYKMQKIDSARRCGSFVLDVISLMMQKKYKITVQYYPVEETCNIHVTYIYDNAQFLNRPPSFTHENNTTLAAEDRKYLMNYVMGLIRINNRLILREEQYYRELEYTARSDATFLAILESMELNAPSTWLVKNVRQYEAIIPNPIREIIWNDGTYIVQEEYTSAGFTVETIKKGLQNKFYDALLLE
ncbi:uncharacterized protein [Rhodnius prolixus]|uniref:uncharacterized protein n=1 Tax=Rhodnius prolixus TaxID=13249 RepID=UPI003D18E913